MRLLELKSYLEKNKVVGEQELLRELGWERDLLMSQLDFLHKRGLIIKETKSTVSLSCHASSDANPTQGKGACSCGTGKAKSSTEAITLYRYI